MALHDGAQGGALDAFLADRCRDDDGAGKVGALEPGGGVDHRRQGAFHVGAAAPPYDPVGNFPSERLAGPRIRGNHVAGVHVGVEEYRRAVLKAAHDSHRVAGGVDLNVVEEQPPHLSGDVLRDVTFGAQDALQPNERAGEVDEGLFVVGWVCWHRVPPARRRVSLARISSTGHEASGCEGV